MKILVPKSNGKNTCVSVNNTILSGVYYAEYETDNSVYEIKEILSQNTFDTVPGKSEYKIKIKTLPYLNSLLFSARNFTLSFKDADVVTTFSKCNTITSQSVIEAEKALEVYEVKATKITETRETAT